MKSNSFFFSILLLLTCTFGLGQLQAQCNGDLILTTQAEVNAFNCNLVSGSLIIQEAPGTTDPIVDLNPIALNVGYTSISIAGDLVVSNCPSLTSLLGLDLINDVGGQFLVQGNASLTTPSQYAYFLVSAGSMHFISNPQLTSFPEFNSLTSIAGELKIENCEAITDLAGFNVLASCGSIHIEDNDGLVAITGLNSVTNLAQDLYVSNNQSLETIGGFASLITVSSVSILDNNALTALDGLFQIQSVSSLFELQDNEVLATLDTPFSLIDAESIILSGNSALTSVTCFTNLENVMSMTILGNYQLTTFNNFNSLSSLTDFSFTLNTVFSDCCSLFPLVLKVSENAGTTLINGNDLSCDSMADLVTPTTTFSSQSEINNFQFCGPIMGDLIIEDDNDGVDNIVNLNPLYLSGLYGTLSHVSGDVIIRNCDVLTSLYGLDGIETIDGDLLIQNNAALPNTDGGFYSLLGIGGKIQFSNNPSMTSIQDFFFLESAGGIEFDNNDALSIMEGFHTLHSINGSLGLQIRENDQLNSIPLFGSLMNTPRLTIDNNDALISFDGFQILQTVPSDLGIEIKQNDALTSMADFISLTMTGRLNIDNNDALISFDGFQALQTVPSDLGIEIKQNDALTSMADFDALTMTGRLNIDNNDALISFDGFQALQTVPSDIGIEIKQNDALTSMADFDALTITGRLNIDNNDALISFDGFQALQTVPSDIGIEIKQNDALTSMADFNSLTMTGRLNIDNNNALTTIGGLNFLTSVNASNGLVIKANDALSTLTPFNSLSSSSKIEIEDNDALTSINGFILVQSLTNPSGTGLKIKNNALLTAVNGFGQLSTIQANLEVSSNPVLSNCCWLPPLMDITAGSIIIANNASGCDSENSITGTIHPIGCEGPLSIPTESGSCQASFLLNHPVASDDCSIPVLTITDESGTTTPVVSGGSSVFSAGVGTHEYTYISTDSDGNTASCTRLVNIVDTEEPTWLNASDDIIVYGECGVDLPDDLAAAHIPQAVDNCSNVIISPAGLSSVLICGTSTEHAYSYVATDESGNVSSVRTITVMMEDTQAPVISGVPADVTISCDEPFPSIPQVIAMDLCAGDITGQITMSSSLQLAPCDGSGPATTHTYTWDVEDGCGNMTSKSWTVSVQNNFSFDLGADVFVCDQSAYTLSPSIASGEEYSWSTGASSSSITVTESGTYTLQVFNSVGCCYTDDIQVTFGSTPNATATGAELDCTGSPVTLGGNSTTAGVSYAWSGPGGFFSTMQNPMVTAAGMYTLTVSTASGCSTTATALVTTNTDVPDVTTDGGTIDCNTSMVQLTGNSSSAGVTYAWTGPAGFNSSLQNPTVSVAGSYTLTVTAPNGCVANSIAEVTLDNVAPSASLTAGTISCNQPTVTINATVSSDAQSTQWAGPGGFSSSVLEPNVNMAGTYTLTVTGDNGCSFSTAVTVDEDTNAPNVSAAGGTLDCTNSQISLNGGSSTPNVEYNWTGPNGFSSVFEDPTVNEAGSYTLTVTAANGCTASTSVTVTADTDLPDISAFGGEINCNSPSITLLGSTSSSGATLLWTGPNGFSSADAMPTVSQAGQYTLTVTAPGGCVVSQTVDVLDATASPVLNLMLGEVLCEQQMVSLDFSADIDASTILWTGPNGFSSAEQSPMITDNGTYTLSYTAINGCSNSETIDVEVDFDYELELVTTDANSSMGGTASITISGGMEPFTFDWSNGASASTVDDLEAGDHFVIVTDGLGCTQTIDFFIEIINSVEDMEAPQVPFDLYPNPASDRITVRLNEGTETIEKLELMDLSGRKLFERIWTVGHTMDLEVSFLADGMYILRLHSAHAISDKTFIKE